MVTVAGSRIMSYTALPGSKPIQFVLRDAAGGGHYSTGMNTRWCCRCESNQPTKGGKFSRGMLLFTCRNCLPATKACQP